MHSAHRSIRPLFALLVFAASADAQTGQVVNAADGLCLQVNGAIASGARLQTAVCAPNAPNQTFTRTASNELRIAGSLCVDSYGGGKQGAEVGLWGCQGSLNERWSPNNGFLVTENNFCMAVDGGKRAPGTRIIAYSCLNDPSQKWSGPAAAPAKTLVPAPPSVTPNVSAAMLGMISGAYQSDFGRAPRPDEVAYWSSIKATDPRVVSRAAFLQNDRAFLKTDAGERDSIITLSYSAVFHRAPTDTERTYWRTYIINGGATYEELVAGHRDYLAKNPVPVPVHPANTERVEQCFGAVGKGCEGSGSSWYDGRSDLIPMLRLGCSPANNGYRNCWVAPGSIKHDNCCHANPNGKACGGNESSNACSNEWEMACNDVVHGRAWLQTVPDGPSDLTPVVSVRLPSGERKSTAVLCAPGGANISVYHGAAFCCSGRFKETWFNPLLPAGNMTREWGVCADVGSYSVQSVASPKQWTSALPAGPSAPPPPPSAAEISRVRK